MATFLPLLQILTLTLYAAGVIAECKSRRTYVKRRNSDHFGGNTDGLSLATVMASDLPNERHRDN